MVRFSFHRDASCGGSGGDGDGCGGAGNDGVIHGLSLTPPRERMPRPHATQPPSQQPQQPQQKEPQAAPSPPKKKRSGPSRQLTLEGFIDAAQKRADAAKQKRRKKRRAAAAKKRRVPSLREIADADDESPIEPSEEDIRLLDALIAQRRDRIRDAWTPEEEIKRRMGTEILRKIYDGDSVLPEIQSQFVRVGGRYVRKTVFGVAPSPASTREDREEHEERQGKQDEPQSHAKKTPHATLHADDGQESSHAAAGHGSPRTLDDDEQLDLE